MRFVPISLVAVLIPINAAFAQLAGGLSLGGGVGQLGASPWTRETRLRPTLRITNAFGALSLDGTVAERGGAVALDQAALAGLIAAPAFGPFRLGADASYTRSRDLTAIAHIAPSLSVKRGPVGAWFGSAHEQRSKAQLQAGVWTSLRSAVFSLSSRTQNSFSRGISEATVWDSTFNDTTGGWNRYQRTIADTVETRSGFRWSQLEARVDWSHRRIALSGSLAMSRALGDRRDSLTTVNALTWGRVSAAFMLSDRLSLIAGAGTLPASPGRKVSASRFATFGVRFSPAMLLRDPLPAPVRPAASSLSVTQIEPGLYKLVLRVPSARTVELSGDFNRWNAVGMSQASPDVWEATLTLLPGTHRLNVRIDGDRWTAPPGLPSVEDEFNGRVGLLVIR